MAAAATAAAAAPLRCTELSERKYYTAPLTRARSPVLLRPLQWMRNECLNHKYVFGQAMPSKRLCEDLADRHQRTTQTYVRRPYGVGLLVAAYDDMTGPHIFQTCPSGNLSEYFATAIGARSQSAKTYLEKHFQSFGTSEKDDLIMHALRSLTGCVQGDGELTKENGSIAVVGKDQKFTLIENDELAVYLDRLEVEADVAAPAAASGDDEMKE